MPFCKSYHPHACRRWVLMKLTALFLKFLEDISHFCGASDTPNLDFWCYLPWVLKPGGGGGFPHLYAS